jgi:hypothetical protein
MFFCLLFVVRCLPREMRGTSLFHRGSLFVVCCLLFVVRCSLFVVWCLLFVVWCSVFGVWGSLFGVRCSLFVVRCLLFVVCCLLFGVRCLPREIQRTSIFHRGLVFVVCCLVFVVRCLPREMRGTSLFHRGLVFRPSEICFAFHGVKISGSLCYFVYPLCDLVNLFNFTKAFLETSGTSTLINNPYAVPFKNNKGMIF